MEQFQIIYNTGATSSLQQLLQLHTDDYMCAYTHIYMCIYIHMYIYREKDIDTDLSVLSLQLSGCVLYHWTRARYGVEQ